MYVSMSGCASTILEPFMIMKMIIFVGLVYYFINAIFIVKNNVSLLLFLPEVDSTTSAILLSTSRRQSIYRYFYNWENETLTEPALLFNKSRSYLYCAAASKFKGAPVHLATAGPTFTLKICINSLI